eukprot:m.165018 g.165018  ORF g.165018 m.165018 type:complete len:190 (-) comp14416_c0_seq2:1112-1681(-)
MGQAATVERKVHLSVPEPRNTTKYPACDVCDDGEHVQTQPQAKESTTATATTRSAKPVYGYMHTGCPLNRRELGRASWAFLHTMAAYYPERATEKEQEQMLEFMKLYIIKYPCGYCGDTSWQDMMRNPPRLEGRQQFSQWMCEMHNDVNERLGKPLFNCSQYLERWRTGPPDGSCGPNKSNPTGKPKAV